MQALLLETPRNLHAIDVEPPGDPGPGEALVRVHRVGVCGTDISGYLGKMPFFTYPRIPGHELGVEVLAVGEGVEHIRAGDRCAVEPYINDPTSYASRRGFPNCCERLEVLGVHRDGGLRERFVLPARKLHPSGSLPFEALALVETLAIGCHAVGRSGLQADETALIVGAGPIGLAVLEFVRLAGVRPIVLDRDDGRLRFAREVMGVDRTILAGPDLEADLRDATGGNLADVVIDATGSSASMGAAFGYVAPGGGRLVYVGITTDEVKFRHTTFHRPEGTLLCSRNALPADFARIIGLIEAGQIDTAPWITHRVGFADLPAAFPELHRPGDGRDQGGRLARRDRGWGMSLDRNPCIPLGLQASFGFGDRIGLATPGHLAALRRAGAGIAPIFPQQSIREMARTGRTPRQVMDEALTAARGLGYDGPIGADADHLKTRADVDATVAAGFTFFTLDPSGAVDPRADDYDEATLRVRFAAVEPELPWFAAYRDRTITLGTGTTVAIDELSWLRAGVKYGRALNHACDLAHYLDRVHRDLGRDYEVELSVDETDQPTTLAEHFLIADRCRGQGVKLVSLAPRFVGDFEKGVDYKGDVAAFQASLLDHAALAEALGPYKLSLHSGSDKLSIYPSLARATRGRFHVKTAGTSYLEALRVVALEDEGLFRRVVAFARAHYEADKATYHVSATLAGTPEPAGLSRDELIRLYLGIWGRGPRRARVHRAGAAGPALHVRLDAPGSDARPSDPGDAGPASGPLYRGAGRPFRPASRRPSGGYRGEGLAIMVDASFLQGLFGLDGQVAVVIGGTGVLCGAMAEGIARAGAAVVVAGRDPAKGPPASRRSRRPAVGRSSSPSTSWTAGRSRGCWRPRWNASAGSTRWSTAPGSTAPRPTSTRRTTTGTG